MIISVNGFIDSLNDADANRYYLLSESHRILGYCHYTKCNFNVAIKEYISALKFSDKVKDNQNLKGDIYKNIADVFYDCENYTLAKELYFKSLDYCLISLDSNNIVHDYRRIGNICYYLSENENPDTLQYYMQKSMNFAKNEETTTHIVRQFCATEHSKFVECLGGIQILCMLTTGSVHQFQFY